MIEWHLRRDAAGGVFRVHGAPERVRKPGDLLARIAPHDDETVELRMRTCLHQQRRLDHRHGMGIGLRGARGAILPDARRRAGEQFD